jgi:mannose-6-phosphate isomerase-like protein (cupin superfamily)
MSEPASPHLTLDGSLVTELIRPERGDSRNVSVAEAVLAPGGSTRPHLHRESDEVYYVLSGKGIATVEANESVVEPGACILILAGRTHCVQCTGDEPLRILCICAPPYTHEQTVLKD